MAPTHISRQKNGGQNGGADSKWQRVSDAKRPFKVHSLSAEHPPH